MPKKTVAEINEQIKAKLKELKGGEARTRRAQKTVSKVDAKVNELREELKQMRLELDGRRSALKEIREDLHVAELEEEVERLRIAVGEAPEDQVDTDNGDEQVTQLRANLDSLSGLIEEGLATRDRLLDRLDRLREREAEAEAALDEAVKEREEDRVALERMRERRNKIKSRTDRPSAHFAYAEFDCRNGQKLPEGAEPAVKDWCERIGEPLRKKFGAVHINSGYRPADYNASVGGEPNSVHIYDFPGRNFAAVAVDVTCETGTPAEWYAFTDGKADGRGVYATFHHADNRGRIPWSAATWSG